MSSSKLSLLAHLTHQKELIERLISQHFPDIPLSADVGEEFDSYWQARKQEVITNLNKGEGLQQIGLEKVIGRYLFTKKAPMSDDVRKLWRSALHCGNVVASRTA
ncbi:hypothetical protein ACGYLI_05145 [Sulfitobacter sp. 1A13421]|uniref:type I restriction endonuclease subunit R, EcoR124 family n=1 Tax=Sulfitobacter sp. 1A13421 TaxID=3368595 RepID=UPI0037453206